MPDPAIHIAGLTKSYGDVQAVKKISFELNDGEVVGFLGANGAGKSTTLKVMTGYLSPTSGTVYVNDMDILHDTYEIQKQIGYLPELNPLYSGSTTLFSKEEFTKTSKELSDVRFLMRKDYLSSALNFIPLNP